MIIDIEPKIELAKGLDAIVIDTIGHEHLYVFRTKDGEDFSAKFNDKDFNEFCPNKTVSEMIKSWEEGLINQLEVAKRVVETNEHPTWTQPIYAKTAHNNRVIGYKPYVLSSTENFKLTIERITKQLGGITFVKIIPTEN